MLVCTRALNLGRVAFWKRQWSVHASNLNLMMGASVKSFLEFDNELLGPGMRSTMGLSLHQAAGAMTELRSQRHPKAPSDR